MSWNWKYFLKWVCLNFKFPLPDVCVVHVSASVGVPPPLVEAISVSPSLPLLPNSLALRQRERVTGNETAAYHWPAQPCTLLPIAVIPQAFSAIVRWPKACQSKGSVLRGLLNVKGILFLLWYSTDLLYRAPEPVWFALSLLQSDRPLSIVVLKTCTSCHHGWYQQSVSSVTSDACALFPSQGEICQLSYQILCYYVSL